MNKKIPEFRNIIKIALFPSSFLVLVPGGEDRQSRRQAGMNIGNSIHRAVERFAVTRVTQSPAGLAPISRITRIRPAKREGETSEKEPRTRFCVSLTTELRNACVTLSDRVRPIFFPRSFSRFSAICGFRVSLFFLWNRRFDLSESKITCYRC